MRGFETSGLAGTAHLGVTTEASPSSRPSPVRPSSTGSKCDRPQAATATRQSAQRTLRGDQIGEARHDAIATTALRRIQVLVGTLDQPCRIDARFTVQRRHAEADRERNRAAIERARPLFDDRAQMLREHDAPRQRRRRKHARELLTAVAREQVLPPYTRANATCEVLEHGIASEVAMRVVDLLEVIDIEHHEREWMAMTARHRDLALEELH